MMELLEQALTDEFDGEVIFAPWLPPTITPPAVVVAPGRPFLVPSTHGGITETWRVMVAVSVKEPRLALSQIRGLALRTRRGRPVGGSRMAGHRRTRSQPVQQTVRSWSPLRRSHSVTYLRSRSADIHPGLLGHRDLER